MEVDAQLLNVNKKSFKFLILVFLVRSSFTARAEDKKSLKMNKDSLVKLFKRILGLQLGILLALGFYHGILVDMGLDPDVLKFLGITLSLLLGIGCFFSQELQCVGLICVTMFCSATGRRTLQGMIFAYLIAGPGQNLIYNGQEVARTFGCSAELAFNLTKEYSDLAVAPFKHAIMGMKEDDADSVSETLKSMNKQISPLKKELEGNDKEEKQLEEESDYVDIMQGNSRRSEEIEEKYAPERKESKGEEIERKYMKDLEIKCQGIISRSTERCRDGFGAAYQSCEDKVSSWVSWLICWPMKLTFVCDIITLLAGGQVCDASENVEPGYGESYIALTHADQLMGKQMGKTHFHYKLPKPDVKLDVKDAAASVRNVMADVRVKMDAAQTILLILRRLLALLFLPVILDSVKYVNTYLKRPDHDNHYITPYFKKIDARRVMQERIPTLLPLKKEEKSKLVNIFSPVPQGPEKKNIFGPYLKLIMLILIAGVMICSDYMLAHTLSLVTKYGRTRITQEGHHTIHITVRGSGFVAKMVRNMVQGFNEDAKINNVFTNEECLPHPQYLSTYYMVKIGLVFLGMAAMIVFDHFPTRMRRMICACFYPKREKQRTLHLYNSLLKSRCTWQMNMRQKLREKADELRQQEAMKFPLPAPVRWFLKRTSRLLPHPKRTCALCSTRETSSRDFISCEKCPNGIDYCAHCWQDLGDVCPACDSKFD